jgi:hypothetical protein
MLVPSSVFQLFAILLLIVPGIVYASVRRRLLGPMPEDREFSVRIARALVVSLVLDLTYVIFGGAWLLRSVGLRVMAGRVVVEDPTRHAATKAGSAMLLLVAVPAALALMAHVHFRWRPLRLYLRPIYHPAPSAWDRSAPLRGMCFVRILKDDGSWVGGYLDQYAFVSTYPEPRDIYIDVQYRMSDTGEFLEPIKDSLGIYLPLTGSETVSWIAVPTEN